MAVTDKYPSCQSLGFATGTSAPSCFKGAGVDPPGTPNGIDFCVNPPSSSSQPPCNAGLHCCSDDNKCHECCSDSDCTDPSAPICDSYYHTCRHCQNNQECVREGKDCCLYLVDTTKGSCVSKGYTINVNGKSYLCDPPEGFVNNFILNYLTFNPFS